MIRFGARKYLLATVSLLLLFALPVLAATVVRVCSINVLVPNPAIPKFKVYTNAGISGETAIGTLSIGPPAWDSSTEYFTGNLTDVERTTKGVRLAATGTFGTRILATREAASAFVTVEDGKISISGLPPDYTVTAVKYESGSLYIYPAPAAGN